MNQDEKLIFEISWETCNKVGGIYTVIRSKLAEAQKNFKDNYFLIGPLFENNPEFQESGPDEHRDIRVELKRKGIPAKIGTWKIPEKPLVILVDYKGVIDQGKLLYQLWEGYGLDSTTGGWDYIEPVLFSTMAAHVVEAICDMKVECSCITQFHEWMCGAGLLYLKKYCPGIATVFITHATVLGRAISGSGQDLYGKLDQLDPATQASRIGVVAKHSMESICARQADCFCTVSDITALEARHVLGVAPDLILPNGFTAKNIKSYTENPAPYLANRKKLLNFASKFLKKDFPEDKTFIISSSGRKEFRNKGIDLLLESIADLRQPQNNLGNRQILFYMFYLGGYTDHSKKQSPENPEKYFEYSTHPLWEGFNDPVLVKCRELGFQNRQQDNISVIYVPVYLNGSDGVLNMEYYDVLSGCDLTVYPSYYEPWGYTPLESAAYSVPTVSTDLAGFGKWKAAKFPEKTGVHIIPRFQKSMQESKSILDEHLKSIINMDPIAWIRERNDARTVALNADWSILYKEYLKAFEIAVNESDNRVKGRSARNLKNKELFFTGTDSSKPRLRRFSVKVSIPKEIERLREIAYNIWWSWDLDAYEVFARLDPVLFEHVDFNPISLLDIIDSSKLKEAVSNESYMSLYETVIKKFDKYVRQPHVLIQDMGMISKERPVAYFSMEFGFHESIPIYSGGLGILSGDHIKSSSDINIPLIGVGLLYKNGYFKQTVSKEGEQKVEYPVNDFFRMPIKEVQKNEERLLISVDLPGRILYARVWHAQIGRVSMYLFDTDIPDNSQSDREITAKLYGGGSKTRIEQEILLGIGGVRLLERELHINPSVYHLNEGHSAFLIIERLLNLIKYEELDLETAKEVIKSGTVFTTHTPVPAGNETFDLSLVENYLKNYVTAGMLNWSDFVDMGHKQLNILAPYEMTVLALKHTYKHNGVSMLHGEVSKRMWSELWSGFLTEEVPIMSITNGVHVPTWLTTEMKALFTKYCAISLNTDLLNPEIWEKIEEIPDAALWQTHMLLKNKLFSFIKEKISENWTREGEDPALLDHFFGTLNSNPLTIGFARRFATYKRPMLFMRDLNRLRKFTDSRKQPVQFVIAGKCHPEDKEAYSLIREIVQLSKQKDFLGKIVFLEDYDMRVARRMVSGCDIWLNNPRRPLEASGTSGIKAGINGVINCSILDGWWDEGWDGTNGWAIGDRREYKNLESQDISDSDSFYDLLESEIIPAYYHRNSQGIPEKWIATMRRSLISIIAQYNTHRMLKDYLQKMYIPTAKRHTVVSANNYSVARKTAEWKRAIRSKFSSMHINNVSITGIQGDRIDVNDEVKVMVELDKGRMQKEEIRVELVLIKDQEMLSLPINGNLERLPEKVIKTQDLALDGEKENKLSYSCVYHAELPGKFNYGIRVVPAHQDIDDTSDMNLVHWG